MAIELYRNRDGQMLATFVTCGHCDFESVNAALIYCPNDGTVLGESAAPYTFVAGEVVNSLLMGATFIGDKADILA